MVIQANCENGHALRVEDKYAGKKGRCPKCQAPVYIPQLDDQATAIIDELPPAPPEASEEPAEPQLSKKEAKQQAKLAKRQAKQQAKEAKLAKKGESSGKGSGSKATLLAIVLLAAAGGAGYWSWNQMNQDPAVARAARAAKFKAEADKRMADAKNIKIDPNLKKTPDITGDDGGLPDSVVNDYISVRKVVAAFMEASKTNDVEATKAVLTEKAKANFVPPPGGGAGPDATFEIDSTTVDGDDAQSIVKMKASGLDMTGFVKLRREGDEWRVFGMGMGDPNDPETGQMAAKMFMDFEKTAMTPDAGEPQPVASNPEDEADVKEVVAAFFEAGVADDVDVINSHLTEKSIANFKNTIRSSAGAKAKVELGEVNIAGTEAQATVTLKSSGLDAPMYVTLRREADVWQVYGMGNGDITDPLTGGFAANLYKNFETPGSPLKPLAPSGSSSMRGAGPGAGNPKIKLNVGGGTSNDGPEIKLAGEVAEEGVAKKLFFSYEKPMGGVFSSNDAPPPIFGKLELSGESLVNPTLYSELNLTATDDQSNELKLQESQFGQEQTFKELPNAVWMQQGFSNQGDNETVKIPIVMDGPAANAKQLVKVDGSVRVMVGGEIKKTVVANALSFLDKELKDPVLEQAGLTAKLSRDTKQQFQKPDTTIRIELAGPAESLLDVGLQSSNGERIFAGSSQQRVEGKLIYTVLAQEKIADDAQLVFELAIGQEAVTVPFAFANAELPTHPVNEPAQVVTEGVKTDLKVSYEAPQGVFVMGRSKPLFATLTFTSPIIGNASKYGVFQLKTAEDNSGAMLKLANPAKGKYGQRLSNVFSDFHSSMLDVPNTLVLNLTLTKPEAAAKTLNLAGSIRFKGRESIVVDNVMNQIGKELNDPRLRSLGSFKVTKPKASGGDDPNKGLVIEFKGDEEAIESIDIVDSSGKQLNNSSFSMGGFGSKTIAVNADKKLPKDAQLKIIKGGKETVSEIPFEFKGIALPAAPKGK